MATTFAATMVQVHPFRKVKEGTIEYLVVQRAPDQRAYPGLWQVITGRIEEGETAWQAALREVKEETSLLPARVHVLPYVTALYNPHLDSIINAPCFACEIPAADKIILSHEHEAFRWCGFEEAMALLVFPSHHDATKILREYLLQGEGTRNYASIPI